MTAAGEIETGTTGGEQYVENICDSVRVGLGPLVCPCCRFICKRVRANYEVEIHHDLSNQRETAVVVVVFFHLERQVLVPSPRVMSHSCGRYAIATLHTPI